MANPLPLLTVSEFKKSAVQAYLDKGKQNRVASALEMYRMKKGPYPDKLSDLVMAGILRKKDMTLTGGKTLNYVRTGRTYRLSLTAFPE